MTVCAANYGEFPTGDPNADGSVTVRFGDFPDGTPNAVPTTDGWNFLVRKDSETAAVPRSFADAYEDVEAAVRKRRSQELYDRWLDILKGETYIKIF